MQARFNLLPSKVIALVLLLFAAPSAMRAFAAFASNQPTALPWSMFIEPLALAKAQPANFAAD